MKVLLSGIQPTNRLTLGNYIGAMKNWVELQNEYYCILSAVDLHSITVRQDPKQLREQTYYTIASYLAAGLDPSRCILFIQSHVSAHAEAAWVFSCFAYMGELNRMTQFKDKSSKQGKNIPVGLFSYPILMAADILLYQADVIPVGQDQKQHVELTRDLAGRMNRVYGEDLFKMPEPFIPHVGGRIMSLQDPTSKMSKSDSEAASVFLSDTDSVIAKKIKRAVTDSGSEIEYNDSKPGVKNLIEIQASLLGKPPADIVKSYVGKQYGHLKVDTADIVVAALKPIREKTQEILDDRKTLDEILAKGAGEAEARAQKTLVKLYERVGFAPRP